MVMYLVKLDRGHDCLNYLKDKSKKASNTASKIYSDLEKKGQMIELNDIYIASISIEQNSILATDNINHFNRISSLKTITI